MFALALSLFLGVKVTEAQTVMRFKVERCAMTTQRPMRFTIRGRVVADRIATFHPNNGKVTLSRWRTIAKPPLDVFQLDGFETCPKGTIEVTKVKCPTEPEKPCTEDLSDVVTTAPPFGKEKARR